MLLEDQEKDLLAFRVTPVFVKYVGTHVIFVVLLGRALRMKQTYQQEDPSSALNRTDPSSVNVAFRRRSTA